jgi:hypothetical protein
MNLVRALNMATTCHLLNCNTDNALKISKESIQLFDNNINNDEERNELLCDSYCLLGLSFLINNNYKDSEKYLQKSICICSNSTSFLVSMNNLGTLYLFNNNYNNNQNEISVIQELEIARKNKFQNIYKNSIELEQGKDYKIVEINNKEFLQKAIYCWENALLYCTKDSFEFNFEKLASNNNAKNLITELNNDILDRRLSDDDVSNILFLFDVFIIFYIN